MNASAAVSQLGYVAFSVTDLDAWRSLTTEILGLDAVPAGSGLQLRMDERPYRIVLTPGSSNALACAGWETPDATAFEALVGRIRAAGVAVMPANPEECRARQVAGLVRFVDPGGFLVELNHGPRLAERPFAPTAAISSFKTGTMGLGHIVMHYADRESAVRFYCDVLGFRVSDTCRLANSATEATFLHCNARHHSLAIIAALPGNEGKVSHLMIEAEKMEDVGRTYDLCVAKDLPIVLSIGQHTNDRMLSFYLGTPSAFSIEVGYGGLEIDDETWRIAHWDTGSYWGHKRNAS